MWTGTGTESDPYRPDIDLTYTTWHVVAQAGRNVLVEVEQ